MWNKDFIIIHHYLRLLQTSCKMKFVSCMSETNFWNMWVLASPGMKTYELWGFPQTPKRRKHCQLLQTITEHASFSWSSSNFSNWQEHAFQTNTVFCLGGFLKGVATSARHVRHIGANFLNPGRFNMRFLSLDPGTLVIILWSLFVFVVFPYIQKPLCASGQEKTPFISMHVWKLK